MGIRLISAIAMSLCLSAVYAATTAVATDASILHATIQYPPDAVQSHHEGVVMVAVHVDATGHVSELHLDKTSGFAELDQAALSATQSWLFTPATHNGHPVDQWVTLPVSYKLNVAAPSPAKASAPLTPLEHAALVAWLQYQPSGFGYLFACKGDDGKFFTTRVLAPGCVVHEPLGPFVVLSNAPTSGWRKVQSTPQAEFYLDDSSFSYVDAQAKPKPGNGVTAWLKVVYRRPQTVAGRAKKEIFTAMVTSVTYSCKANSVDSGVAWLYDGHGELVDAYPPSNPPRILQPNDPMASVFDAYCSVDGK
jgi:TonB family protein